MNAASSDTHRAAPHTAAARHAALRWLGPPLLLSGALLLLGALVLVAQGAPWSRIPWALFGMGLGLATFGANNDTALALAQQAASRGQGGLSEALSRELEAELEQDRGAVLGLKASPVVGMVMPALALLVQGWLCWRLLHAG